MKELLGIDEDYYIAVPSDPTDEEMKRRMSHVAGAWLKAVHEQPRSELPLDRPQCLKEGAQRLRSPFRRG